MRGDLSLSTSVYYLCLTLHMHTQIHSLYAHTSTRLSSFIQLYLKLQIKDSK
ncbi:hypothetical protein Lalb_Chr05g0217871 [Lupinus albus]|uniref:Uncharacterized protein n=1 Tax=Lupinus albus TaxID=3870 RepID=A0A6A4QJ60_LUPAL|nr:hypothetical protein Lalb_Chr05g0217871 [Lupinus albus]